MRNDSNYFFGNLQKKRRLSKEELYNSFPNSEAIAAYANEEDARRAVEQARSMRLVEDADNIKGFDFHSRVTPVIFKVTLRKDIDEGRSVSTIHFVEIDSGWRRDKSQGKFG